MTAPAVGAIGFAAYDLEAVKGVAAANVGDNFAWLTGNTVSADPDVIRRTYFAGHRTAGIATLGKMKIRGNLVHPLGGDMMARFILAALGMETFHPTEAAIAWTAGATSGGLTTFATVASPIPGSWVRFGSGSTQEHRVVFPNPLGSGWAVRALSPANQAATGTAHQVVQHEFVMAPVSDSHVFGLPTLSCEINEGAQWSWLLAGCHVAKYNVKGAKEDIEVTNDIIGTEVPLYKGPGDFTPFDPTVANLTELTRPYTINHGTILVPNDGSGSGSSVFGPIATLEDWEYDFDNGVLEKAFWDGTPVYKAFPGIQKSTIKYRYAIAGGRPDVWQDFINQLHAAPVPFLAEVQVNNGTPSAPIMAAYSIYSEAAKMTKATVTRTVNDTLTLNVEADVERPLSGASPTSIFVMNSDVLAAYVGS